MAKLVYSTYVGGTGTVTTYANADYIIAKPAGIETTSGDTGRATAASTNNEYKIMKGCSGYCLAWYYYSWSNKSSAGFSAVQITYNSDGTVVLPSSDGKYFLHLEFYKQS